MECVSVAICARAGHRYERSEMRDSNDSQPPGPDEMQGMCHPTADMVILLVLEQRSADQVGVQAGKHCCHPNIFRGIPVRQPPTAGGPTTQKAMFDCKAIFYHILGRLHNLVGISKAPRGETSQCSKTVEATRHVQHDILSPS